MGKFENDMSTPYLVALHYVECYALHFPDSGAKWAADDLRKVLENYHRKKTMKKNKCALCDCPIAGGS